MLRWAKELERGYYAKLLERGWIEEKDQEPDVSKFGFYFDAFRELSSCRAAGMEPGPIPFTAIREYSTLYGVGDFEEFLYLIRVMDNCLLAEMAKRKPPAK